MSINFFYEGCQSSSSETRFGLCDDNNNSPAYIDITDNTKWIAIVENDNNKDVTFTAIDNCIPILRENGDMENRCDGMLTYSDNIVFVELKDQMRSWINDSINQIEVTLKHFIENHNWGSFKHKRAFLANKQHQQFNYVISEKSQQFFSLYNVRLLAYAIIKV